jgi:hypothetical protein
MDGEAYDHYPDEAYDYAADYERALEAVGEAVTRDRTLAARVRALSDEEWHDLLECATADLTPLGEAEDVRLDVARAAVHAALALLHPRRWAAPRRRPSPRTCARSPRRAVVRPRGRRRVRSTRRARSPGREPDRLGRRP